MVVGYIYLSCHLEKARQAIGFSLLQQCVVSQAVRTSLRATLCSGCPVRALKQLVHISLSSCEDAEVGVATGLDLCSQHQGFVVFACDTFFAKGHMGRSIEHVGILGFLVKMHTCCVGFSLLTLLLS